VLLADSSMSFSAGSEDVVAGPMDAELAPADTVSMPAVRIMAAVSVFSFVMVATPLVFHLAILGRFRLPMSNRLGAAAFRHCVADHKTA